MGNANDEIEQQLLRLLRRTQAIHVRTSSGDVVLERSSYGILCLILDEGPQRLGTIAQTFTLDPSTITRQVQAVVNAGLAEKAVDPSDRRATLLSLTEEGRVAIEEARNYRQNQPPRGAGGLDRGGTLRLRPCACGASTPRLRSGSPTLRRGSLASCARPSLMQGLT